LYSPQFGELTETQREFEDMVIERLGALLMLRYADSDPGVIQRAARVGLEMVKKLTGLAVASNPVDMRYVDELKLMLRAYFDARFGKR
jgi:hypothetical protein